MAKKQSITTPAVKETPKPRLSPQDAKSNLKRLASDIRKNCEHLESVYTLTELDEENPVITGATYFINEIRQRLAQDAEWIDKISDDLYPEGKEGGAE